MIIRDTRKINPLKSIEIFTVRKNLDKLKIFAQSANLYKNDWDLLLRDYPLIKNLKDVFIFSKNKYTSIDGDHIMRPLHFARVGGHCSNTVIFILSYLLYNNVPTDNIFLVEKEVSNDLNHLYLKLEIDENKTIILDPYPDTKYNETLPGYIENDYRLTELL